jgi:hypothetical protein
MLAGLALNPAFASARCFAQNGPSAGTTPFVLDGNRMYAELDFVRPDGSVHRALAFVDMGSPSMTLRESLFEELRLDQGQPLSFRVGNFLVAVPRADVTNERREPRLMGPELKVEAMLPAGILKRYRITIDYQQRTLTFARSATTPPQGVAIPFQINDTTGLISVSALIGGTAFAIAIDNGSAFTWMRRSSVSALVASHPVWTRGVGAVGPSNMMMSGDGTEKSGTLLRIPEISIGPLMLRDVGVLAAGPSRIFPGNLDLFDWYSKKNAGPVIGWIGGNVLKNFRLTIDYPNRMSYWLRQSEADVHELDQVGITLRFERGAYVVAAIATKNGKPTVDGVLLGDTLIRIGELDVTTATLGAIYDALHGAPGDMRSLVLDRNGTHIVVTAAVTAF